MKIISKMPDSDIVMDISKKFNRIMQICKNVNDMIDRDIIERDTKAGHPEYSGDLKEE